MNTRGRLDQIEDMNFAVTQMIHKGKEEAQVIQLLEKEVLQKNRSKPL